MPDKTNATEKKLTGHTVLITGAARRIGRSLALAAAGAGARVVIHYNTSRQDAEETRRQVEELSSPAYFVQANLLDLEETATLIQRAADQAGPITCLVNNASTFTPGSLDQTTRDLWDANLAIHLTVPFLLCQAFARALPESVSGRIVNMLDWRALRPGADHFAYSISKASLVALTRASAAALAPRISVNGLALGAILPPEGKAENEQLIRNVPARRWGSVIDVQQALLFLLSGPAYITGEIMHVDGGRHLI